jgi:hypothetical protein
MLGLAATKIGVIEWGFTPIALEMPTPEARPSGRIGKYLVVVNGAALTSMSKEGDRN